MNIGNYSWNISYVLDVAAKRNTFGFGQFNFSYELQTFG